MLSPVVLCLAMVMQLESPVLDQFGDKLPRGAIARLGTIRWRHSDYCRRVAFVGNGESLVTAGFDGAVNHWEVPSGRKLRTFGTGLGAIWGLDVSRDGRLLAIGAERMQVHVWNVETGQPLWNAKVPAALFLHVPAVAFSPDSHLLAVMRPPRSIMIFNAESGEEVRSIELHQRDIFESLCWSPDGQLIACGSRGGLVCISDVATGKTLVEVKHNDQITSLMFSPDGSKLASASGLAATHRSPENQADPTLRVWDVKTGRELQKIRAEGEEISALAYSPDGKSLAFADRYRARLFNVLPDGALREQRALAGTMWIDRLQFSRNGKYLAAGSHAVSPFLWDLSTVAELVQKTGHTDSVSSAEYSMNGRSLISISLDRSLIAWDWTTGDREPFPMVSTDPPDWISQSGRYLVVSRGTPDFYFRFIDLQTKQEFGPFATPGAATTNYDFDKRRNRLASAGTDGVRVWDLTTKRAVWHSDFESHHVRFALDGTQVVVWSCYSPEIKAFDSETGKVKGVMNIGRHGPKEGDISPNGRLLAIAVGDPFMESTAIPSAVDVFDLTTRKEIRRVTFDGGKATCVRFYKTDQFLVSGHADGTVCLWDLKDGTRLKTINCAGPVTRIVVHPNGKTFATVHSDTTILTWHLLE